MKSNSALERQTARAEEQRATAEAELKEVKEKIGDVEKTRSAQLVTSR